MGKKRRKKTCFIKFWKFVRKECSIDMNDIWQWHTETFYIEYLHGKIKNIMVTNWDDHVNRIKRCSFISQKTKCYTLSIIVSVPVRLKFWVQVSLLFFRINNLSMATKVIICFKKLKRIYLLFYDPLYYQDCLLHRS